MQSRSTDPICPEVLEEQRQVYACGSLPYEAYWRIEPLHQRDSPIGISQTDSWQNKHLIYNDTEAFRRQSPGRVGEREIERETGGVLFMWPSEQLNCSEPRRAGNVGKQHPLMGASPSLPPSRLLPLSSATLSFTSSIYWHFQRVLFLPSAEWSGCRILTNNYPVFPDNGGRNLYSTMQISP